MKERVRGDDGWPMPYLRDESQEVARAYGAKTTPDVFVVDSGGALRYRGAPDPDSNDPTLNATWLREALDAMLAGEEIARPETEPVGCSVKWK
jgi:AhpC/TSA family protein